MGEDAVRLFVLHTTVDLKHISAYQPHTALISLDFDNSCNAVLKLAARTLRPERDRRRANSPFTHVSTALRTAISYSRFHPVQFPLQEPGFDFAFPFHLDNTTAVEYEAVL